jgi:hypothetical protein
MEPFSPLKSSNKKKKDSRNDIWTNAILSEVERDSEISSSTIGNTLVNISVSRNHLKLNILLRILMIIVYIWNVCFVPWMQNDLCNIKDSPEKHPIHDWNHNPFWLFYDGSLLIILQLADNKVWSRFSSTFWSTVGLLIIAGLITLIISVLVLIFEILAILSILNVVLDHKIIWVKVSFFQKYNFIFIMINLLVWFLLQNAWSKIDGLSFGFYIMIGLVFWCLAMKLYYKYYKSRLHQRRMINKLLEE